MIIILQNGERLRYAPCCQTAWIKSSVFPDMLVAALHTKNRGTAPRMNWAHAQSLARAASAIIMLQISLCSKLFAHGNIIHGQVSGVFPYYKLCTRSHVHGMSARYFWALFTHITLAYVYVALYKDTIMYSSCTIFQQLETSSEEDPDSDSPTPDTDTPAPLPYPQLVENCCASSVFVHGELEYECSSLSACPLHQDVSPHTHNWYCVVSGRRN